MQGNNIPTDNYVSKYKKGYLYRVAYKSGTIEEVMEYIGPSGSAKGWSHFRRHRGEGGIIITNDQYIGQELGKK